MAITDIVSDIAGVGPTANYTLGANTEAPYAGVSILALTDGSSAATASKNMAKIDNRYLFERRYTIEKAGLTYDPLDDSQFVRALQKLPNISPQSYGTFASVLAPTLAPSEANPQTVLTNANQEVFAWSGTKRALIADGYMVTSNAGAIIVSDGVNSIINAATCPRDGFVIVSFGINNVSSQKTAKYISLNLPGTGFDNFSGSSNNIPFGNFDSQSGVTMCSVFAGQVISIGFYSLGGATNIDGSTILIKYIG
jgi:hypothetical protein